MTDVVAHLRACQTDYIARHRTPRVAWDCMSAETWSNTCGRLAEEIETLGLTGDQAIGFLKGRAHAMRTRADAGVTGLGMIVSMDVWREMDAIIDPIARDRRGWIELSGHREHFGREGLDGLPTYRRMLGANTCVSTLTREHTEVRRGRYADPSEPRRFVIEDEAAWEARRQAWLGRYAGDIWVVHREGGWHRDADATTSIRYTPLYGTVADHMVEPAPRAFTDAYGLVSDITRRPALEKAA